jgi:hypothetical protein
MPLHPNVRRCTHIKITGHRCGSPALKQEYFCYFHTRMIKGVQTRVDSEIHPVALIENPEAIQTAIMHMIDAVLKGAIDNKRATIVLKALYIAVRNSRNVYFHIRQDDMVREVPNYAHQYLTEHPELNPPEPCADSRLDCPAEHSLAEACHPEPAQASAADPADPKKACHAEGARLVRDSAPHPATRANAAAGNFPHPPEKDSEKVWGENIPPLTTRQSERWNEIKKMEACIDGAMRGNWRDLRTVFTSVGPTPRKPPRRHKM